ncbi:uncharacterized protein BDW43DRAFT_319874 [Aspergillus alliaceus]|uniref:uncharacterized protein n=1 Tax=Petromyces alliaceus TaxID=209559 RepID=UPI0012A54263|nr:uncharacterized protein BDW43DRAFT_319874 [Aspergillus alliaceus]KAB8233115.1 hypothetical protein BDW43DRAFT_319874 [Aspergillus alliaceus]
MTATLNGMYNTAPDTPSPVYPDRLIRPLPKRTLRSRLSSETAESILYPPAPPATQLFYGSCTDNGEAVNESKVYVQQSDDHDQTPEPDHHHPYENGFDAESGDEDGPVVVRRSAGFRESSSSPTMPPGHSSNGSRTQIKSSSAGPDGYDAFENTNNKKKRKIPTPGNLAGHLSALSPEFSSMGLASSAPSTVPVDGISWPQGRSSGRRDGVLSLPGEPPATSDQGIISAAIANAAASFSSPPRGSSNVSMLEQQTTTPTKTQFTFTCESDSSKGMALQPQSPYRTHRSPNSLPRPAQNQRGSSTQGTQTSPNITSQMDQQGKSQQRAPGTEPATAGKKKKRSPGSIYALAARQRKIQQQYSNLHHPPSMEDLWICEFCEYESIFGRPPEALIRQYEIKDRKERKRLAEKKRLLEKAKMKGRKGKKATKNAMKNAATQQVHFDQGCDRASADHSSMGGPGLHDDDDYLANEYDDEPGSAPPPVPPAPPACFKTPLPPGNQATAAAGAKAAIDDGTSRPP